MSHEQIAFVVRLPARAEFREEFEARLLGVVEAMAKEPDFVNTTIHKSAEDPDTYVLYETWACSQEYFMTHHLSKNYRHEYEAALPRLLKAPRQIDFLVPTHAFVKA
ncbi:Quinol monooxygenase YgiN [Cupriavidus sp. YR651]|uniref:putative quinol monooxygenase n=1 Tax=Cupriavidus sp. YR651 TaxID=1855315 RepID=UPI000888E514|nr:antibiotic biosynthesis monooxygenase family protein [Cupriavidus sp. YR651]SDD13982.1 Quinol monooxygenase YgiN [Cupriavidus sp. YR651]